MVTMNVLVVSSTINRDLRKTDRFHQVDNEVAVKYGAGCRFPYLSESSDSSDTTGTSDDDYGDCHQGRRCVRGGGRRRGHRRRSRSRASRDCYDGRERQRPRDNSVRIKSQKSNERGSFQKLSWFSLKIVHHITPWFVRCFRYGRHSLLVFDTDIDECAVNNGDCHNLADCANTEGSFTCTCQAGYTGDGTQTCTGKYNDA